jgi:hypothetical protein
VDSRRRLEAAVLSEVDHSWTKANLEGMENPPAPKSVEASVRTRASQEEVGENPKTIGAERSQDW